MYNVQTRANILYYAYTADVSKLYDGKADLSHLKLTAPEELCKKAKDTFDARECGNVLCDAEQNDEQCSNALEKLTSDCSFSFDCPPSLYKLQDIKWNMCNAMHL